MTNNKIIIDEQEDWKAVIEDLGDTIVLSFVTKPSEIPIQGEVDEALEDIFGWETPIGIADLEMEMDDGSYIVYYGDLPKEQYAEFKPKIIDYLTSIYNQYKDRFIERIEIDLQDYDEF